MPGGRRVWIPKKTGEIVQIPFDFAGELAPGESLSSATVRANVYSGNDANPSAIVFGSPVLDGSIVYQGVRAGVVGTIYGLVCKATTSSGETPEISAFCAIETDLP